MSQHIFDTTRKGEAVRVMMGWDRPLHQFFLVVEGESDDVPEIGGELPEEGYLYSNLVDLGAQDASELDYFLNKLKLLEITVPQSMVAQILQDRLDNAGNRICIYAQDGTFTDNLAKRPAPTEVTLTAGAPAGHGQLAFAGGVLLRNQVLHSQGGWYIGTCSEDGMYRSRESQEYFGTKEKAQAAFENGTWTQRGSA